MATPKKPAGGDSLFPLRTVLILLFAALVGIAVGVLTYLTAPLVPAAVLAGGTAAAAAVAWLDRFMGP
ncbi:MAG: hypothetical protein E6R06_31190 [Mycobacterium sp.]|nr:MAG: hypothetical protein E6R06_31190 [Mycobacterium sp.]